MTDLRTTYMGMPLRSPIVASAGPLTEDVEMVKRLEAAGAGAVVLPSLFEECMLYDELEVGFDLDPGSEEFAEAVEYLPRFPEIDSELDGYLETIAELKEAVDIPVIASLNATTAGAWLRYAQLLGTAGADGLELNVYRLVTDPDQDGADVEADEIRLVADIVAAVDLPVAVKLLPYYTAIPNVARRITSTGACGLVLFNRFYQPDLDVDTLETVTSIDLSQPWELRLPLSWIATLRDQLPAHVSLAASSGIGSGRDVVKALLAGADVAMMTSALLLRGPEHVATVEGELRLWMATHEHESVRDVRAAARSTAAGHPAVSERASYIRTLQSWAGPQPAASFDPTAPEANRLDDVRQVAVGQADDGVGGAVVDRDAVGGRVGQRRAREHDVVS
jgi:dihydroorotate dehydrogenase (fumarate)